MSFTTTKLHFLFTPLSVNGPIYTRFSLGMFLHSRRIRGGTIDQTGCIKILYFKQDNLIYKKNTSYLYDHKLSLYSSCRFDPSKQSTWVLIRWCIRDVYLHENTKLFNVWKPENENGSCTRCWQENLWSCLYIYIYIYTASLYAFKVTGMNKNVLKRHVLTQEFVINEQQHAWDKLLTRCRWSETKYETVVY